MQKKLDIRRQRRTQMEDETKPPYKDEKPPASVTGKAVAGRTQSVVKSTSTSSSPGHKPAVRASRSAPLKNARSPADQGAMQYQQQVCGNSIVIVLFLLFLLLCYGGVTP